MVTGAKGCGMAVNPMVHLVVKLSWYLFYLFLFLALEQRKINVKTTTNQNYHDN